MARGKKKENLTPEERLQAALVAESEQPYNVPENWCWVTQSSIATFLNGRAYKQAELLEDSSNTPILRVGNLFTNSSWYYSDLKLDTNKYINKGDLIYAWSASFGPFIWDGDKVIYHYHIWKILLSSAINKKYMYFWLLHDTERLKQGGHGTGMIHITKAMMESACIPLPPFSEQQRIIGRIESLFSQLDKAKQKAQDALDSFEIRKTAILQKAFTGELTAQWRKKHNIGRESWKKTILKDVCKINPKKIDTNGLPDDLEVSFFPMASLSEIYGEIMDPQTKPLKDVKTGFTNFSEGDVVFAKITPCMENGKSAIIGKLVNRIGYGTTEFYVLRCHENLYNRYLYHMVRDASFRSKAKSVMSGAVGQQRVPKSFMENYPLNLPSFPEQIEIVRILDKFLAKEQQSQEMTEAVLEQIDLIKKTILDHAFRGELGTNDPREESSVELLKQSFSETIDNEEVTPKQVIKSKEKEIFMPKTIMEVLLKDVRLTPEQLKSETKLSIDDFYAQLKELTDNGSVAENRENGESYLEVANENRQTENQQL